jgi:predicted RND superfamily exporter protein
MQLEIRNAVERDQLLYNGLGLLFGAIIAAVFFRRVSLMLVAALPPVIAVAWSLGLLGWMDFKLNLFLNVMTPLIMVMGFADSMQMVSAIRIRLREGDSKYDAVKFAVEIVGPMRAGARRCAVVVLGVASLRFRVDPHVRFRGRHVDVHFVHCRDRGVAAVCDAVHSQ